MHVGLISHEYPPGPHGGVGTFTCDLAEGLASHGHKVTVFVVEMESGTYWSSSAPRPELRNLRVVPVLLQSPAWMRWRPGALWVRWKLLQRLKSGHRRERFDLIECMDNGGLVPFGGFKDVPMIVRLHGATFLFDYELGSDTSDEFTHWMEKRALAKASFLVGVSNYIARRQLELGGISRSADDVIHNAVDTDFFSPDPNVEIQKGLIVFANSIHPRKGIFELCRAMNIVSQAYPHARLLMIGKHMTVGKSGRPLWEDALAEVSPKFRERVTFTGRLTYRSEVLAHMRKAHLCCYPSKLEGFGIAPVEAMSLGKPTIFSRIGPGPEVIEDGISGLLCDPDKPEDIAEKIGRILSDDALAERLGREARKRAVAQFDKRDWIDKNIAFYSSCLDRTRTTKPQ